MADTRVQVQVERWVREVALPQRFGHTFSQQSVALTWGGKFIVDALSADGGTVACVSTAASWTAGGRPAIGKYQKIRADALFLLHIAVPKIERLLVFTDLAMYEHFRREQGRGRFPPRDSIELLYVDVPEALLKQLRASRHLASMEVSPQTADGRQEQATTERTPVRAKRMQDAGTGEVPREREQLTSFLLAQRGRAFCDDCLAALVRLPRRQNAQRLTSRLGATEGYRRMAGHCSHCDAAASGSEKLVTTAV